MIKMTDFLLIVIIPVCFFLNDNVFFAIKNRSLFIYSAYSLFFILPYGHHTLRLCEDPGT